MLAVAQTVDPTVDWREGNAASLPVDPAERFSVLSCHQGLQFVPDKPAAIREMRRVLTPGGRAAIATWQSVEDSPGVRALNAVVERHVGPVADSRHSFGDADALKKLLVDGGDDVAHAAFAEVAFDPVLAGQEVALAHHERAILPRSHGHRSEALKTAAST